MKTVLQNIPTHVIPNARLALLAKKVYDKTYMDNAIQRIAMIMSRQLVEDKDFTRK
jgi:hypothetical protein